MTNGNLCCCLKLDINWCQPVPLLTPDLLICNPVWHIQGISKRLFPGCENMLWKNCVFLPAEGKQNATFSPDFTQPRKRLLEIPCICQTGLQIKLNCCFRKDSTLVILRHCCFNTVQEDLLPSVYQYAETFLYFDTKTVASCILASTSQRHPVFPSSWLRTPSQPSPPNRRTQMCFCPTVHPTHSLIADVGGYLGLLLGQSIYGIFEMATYWLKYQMKCGKNRSVDK